MAETEFKLPQHEISGKRFLAALGVAVMSAAGAGALSYFVLRFVSPNIREQAIVMLVYTSLVVMLCVFFKPATQSPIGLRFTGAKHLIASIGLLFATVIVSALFYYLLSSLVGPLLGVVRQTAALATDAKRLQGQPTMAWVIAIPRGVLLVPLFEEVFFRGLLLIWLRKHLSEELAVVVMAGLFALEHGSFIVGPYAFLLGLTMGYVRLRTDSTLNTWIMHSLHNAILLAIGLEIFGRP